jgi:hypothetical protein
MRQFVNVPMCKCVIVPEVNGSVIRYKLLTISNLRKKLLIQTSSQPFSKGEGTGKLWRNKAALRYFLQSTADHHSEIIIYGAS